MHNITILLGMHTSHACVICEVHNTELLAVSLTTFTCKREENHTPGERGFATGKELGTKFSDDGIHMSTKGIT